MPKNVFDEPTARATIESIRLKKDRDTLGIILSRVKELKMAEREAKEQLPPLVEQATLLLQGHDIKSMAYQDKYFTVVNGTNVSYSQKNLAEAMLKYHIKADIIQKVLEEARSVKTYTTLTMTEPKKSEADGGDDL